MSARTIIPIVIVASFIIFVAYMHIHETVKVIIKSMKKPYYPENKKTKAYYTDMEEAASKIGVVPTPHETAAEVGCAEQLKRMIDPKSSAAYEFRRILDVLIDGNYKYITSNAYTVADIFILTAYLATIAKCNNMRERGRDTDAERYAGEAADEVQRTVSAILPDGNEMYENRIEFYKSFPAGTGIKTYSEEAKYIIAQDYAQKKYIPWTANSALTVFDFSEMFMIETETKIAVTACLKPLNAVRL